MTTKLALGWGALSCVNAYNPGGRLFVSGPGYISGSVMVSDGVSPRWDMTAGHITACSAQSGAIIEFLTGKTTGANLLIYMTEADADAGYSWGAHFQAWAVAQGHTLTWAGSHATVGGLPFNGYNPADYDAFLIEHDINEARDTAALTAYLTTQGGRVWTSPNQNGAYSQWLIPYGARRGAIYTWALQSELFQYDCAPLDGSPHSNYLSYGVDLEPVTIGSGSATQYALNAQPTKGGCVIWRQD
jgi:hypothetical protein